jgi:hypothetical protein
VLAEKSKIAGRILPIGVLTKNRKRRSLEVMVEAVKSRRYFLLASEQQIAGASHEFVTGFRLCSETKDKESNHGWAKV